MIFATGVKGVAESASVATNFVHDPELSRVAIKLTQLVANFLFRYGDQQSDDITFELRLAKATAANVLGHYSEALGLLPESEIENSANQAQQKSEQAFLLLAARGDAFKGQGKWESAINDYRRALVFHPNHLGVLFQIASVFSQEGNTGEAIKGYGLLIDQVTNRSILPNEAMLILGALVNRSQIFHGTKQYTNALRDWSAAISLLVSFSPTNTSNDFVLGFVFCQRANEYADLEKVPEETSDLDKSIEILTHVSTGLTDNHSKNVLYLVLYNRALVARDQGRYVEAIGYCERALETLRQLDQKDPVTTAQIFCCRGNSNRALGQTNGAMEDFEKAEYELAKTNLLPSGGLATAFNSCGLANEGFENYALAERDFIRAIATYQKLSENDTEFSTNDYAGNLLNLLRLQIKNHQYSAAEQNCHKVLELKPAEKYMQDANVILQFLASNSQK
jgi:tetratricopeptide (TPR) repeat protein